MGGRGGRCLEGRLERGGGGEEGREGGGGGEQTSPLELVTSDRSFISLPPSSQQPASAPQTQARCCSTNTHTHNFLLYKGTHTYCLHTYKTTVYSHSVLLYTHTRNISACEWKGSPNTLYDPADPARGLCAAGCSHPSPPVLTGELEIPAVHHNTPGRSRGGGGRK